MEHPKTKEEQCCHSAASPGIMDTLVDKSHALFQSFKPINSVCMNLCGFHCYNSDPSRQLTVHHFCSHPMKDMYQCIIYDNNTSDAKLIGIEYVVHKRLYETFPQEEKKLWHPHSYEVLSGQIMALNMPYMMEDTDMKWLVNSYGKTWHTWQVDRDEFPFGEPQLMKTFTADGQLMSQLVDKRDADWGVSTSATREHRIKNIKEIEPVDSDALMF
jgi:hypothetical protein